MMMMMIIIIIIIIIPVCSYTTDLSDIFKKESTRNKCQNQNKKIF